MKIQVENLNELKALLGGRPLILFGAGGAGIKIAEFCKQSNISVECFCDNAKAGIVTGLPVISLESLKRQYRHANVVISSIIHYSEMKAQLEDIGFDNQHIFSYSLFMPLETTWIDLEHEANWERMKLRVGEMAKYIDEEDKSIVDYGAGQMYLQALLPPNVKYYPVDYIKRAPEIIVCDLNTGQFPNIQTDVSFLSGILDIIEPAEALIHHICNTTNNKVILSYMVVDKFPDINGRRTSAYVTDFSESDIIAMFDAYGFTLSAKMTSPAHDKDVLFCFERDKGAVS